MLKKAAANLNLIHCLVVKVKLEVFLLYFFLPGWGELPSIQPKSEPAWGEPAAPTSAVDNGTSAWGKPPGGVGGWGDGGHEPSSPYVRANGPTGSAPCKPGNTQK